VKQKLPASRDGLWRRWLFADTIEIRIAQFCNRNDPRVKCRYQGSMPKSIEVRGPEKGKLPYFTYGLSVVGGGLTTGKPSRTTTTEAEFDFSGSIIENVVIVISQP
jgi:hypothetical protein